MLFTSISFLYYFLPIVLIAYFIVPKKAKNFVLFIASMAFYFYGEPKYIFLMLAEIFIAYIGAILIAKYKKKSILTVTLAIHIGLLVFFKYTDFLIANINNIFYSLDRERAKRLGAVFASKSDIGIHLLKIDDFSSPKYLWDVSLEPIISGEQEIAKHYNINNFKAAIVYNSNLFNTYKFRINSISTFSTNDSQNCPVLLWDDSLPIEDSGIVGLEYVSDYSGYVLPLISETNTSYIEIDPKIITTKIKQEEQGTQFDDYEFKYYDLLLNITVFPGVTLNQDNKFEVVPLHKILQLLLIPII